MGGRKGGWEVLESELIREENQSEKNLKKFYKVVLPPPFPFHQFKVSLASRIH